MGRPDPAPRSPRAARIGRRAAPALKVRVAVDEQTAAWLEREAERGDRSVMRQGGRVLDAIATVHLGLRPWQQARLDQIWGQPEELLRVLQQGLKERTDG